MFITSLRLLIFCLLSGLSIRGICHELPQPPLGKIPIIHIHSENLSPLDIGLEIGLQSKLLFPDIESRYDRYLAASLSQMGFNDILRDRLVKLKSHIDNAYQKEMEGIAGSWTLVHDNKLGDGYLSWDEYWVLNLLADIGLPANGTGFGVLNAVSREKSTIIGRNLDLTSTPELRALQAITVYQYSNHVVVNIGFAGIISVLSGFNDSGLFLAHFNAASDLSYQNSYPARQDTKAMQATGFALRKALENTTSVSKATNILAKNTYAISSNILIADKKTIQILEYSPLGKAQIRSEKSETQPNKQWHRPSQIAVVDCHVLNSSSGSCERAKDTYRWERLRAQAIFTENKQAGVQDIAGIMLDTHNQYYEILASDTLQSMIYLPGTGHLYLYAAPVNTTKIPPAYKIYYQDILPEKFRNPEHKNYYFWWLSGFLLLLAIALWVIRRSLREKTNENDIGLDNINANNQV